MSAKILKKSLYLIVNGETWHAAEANAVELGGHLATIEDEAENTWLANTFRNEIYNAYIGLNDEAVEGEWRWSSGINTSFFNWNSNEPNNPGDTETSDYALIHILSSQEWNAPNGTWKTVRLRGRGIAEIPFNLDYHYPLT